MKIWADLERVPWYNLHTDSTKYNIEYGERHGYTVIDVPAETLERWQRVQAEALAVHAEIEAALDAATP